MELPRQLQIPGVVLEEETGRSESVVDFRGSRQGRPVAVRLARNGEEARRLFRQAGRLARVRHSGVAAVLEVGEAGGVSYVVSEVVEGRTLSAVLADGPLPAQRLLSVARALSEALDAVHRCGIIIGRLTPRTIVVDRSGSTRIVPPDVAAPLTPPGMTSDERDDLVYESPERTGMLKRPVDARSDLYALGAVLFQAACGHPAFSAGDPAEVLRRHAAEPVPFLEAVGPAMAAAIRKLLAKEPDERYQSARGLSADLVGLEGIEAALRVDGELVLGSHDERLPVSDLPLAGRRDELERLTSSWKEAREGRGNLRLIIGNPGLGKSRLLRELIHGVRTAGVPAAVGTASTDGRLALAPFRMLWDELARFVRRLPRSQRSFTDEALLAPMPSEQELPGALRRLARGHPGLLLAVEDLDSIDEASLRVLERLASGHGREPLCLVLTATGTGPWDAPGELRTAPRISLGPLDAAATERFVTDWMGGPPVPDGLLAQVEDRSRGCPSRIVSTLEAMLEVGVLRPSWGRWVLESASIPGLPSGEPAQPEPEELPAEEGDDPCPAATLYIRTGRLAEALRVLDESLRSAADPRTRAALLERLATVHLLVLRSNEALTEAEEAFRAMGKRPPRRDFRAGVPLTWWHTPSLPDATTRGEEPEEKRRERQDQVLLHRLHEIVRDVALSEGDSGRASSAHRAALAVADTLGSSREAVRSACAHALLLAEEGREEAALALFDDAATLAEELGERRLVGHCKARRFVALDLLGMPVAADAAGRQALSGYGRWLELPDLYEACASLATSQMLRGAFRDALHWVEFGLQRTGARPEDEEAGLLGELAGALLCLTGRPEEGRVRLRHAPRRIYDAGQGRFARAWGIQNMLASWLGALDEPDPADLDALIGRLEQLDLAPARLPYLLRPLPVLAAYALLGRCASGGPTPARGRMQAMRRMVALVRESASTPTLACHRHILEAHVALLEAKEAAARKCLSKARPLAEEAGSAWGLLEMSVLQAMEAHRHGRSGVRAVRVDEAVRTAAACGWVAREVRLRREFAVETPSLLGSDLPTRSSASSEASPPREARLQMQLDALLQATAAWSSVFDTERLEGMVLEETVRVLGAERAFLFVAEGDALELAAARDASGPLPTRPSDFSRSIVEQARQRGEPVLVSAPEEGEARGWLSIVAHDLRSVLAAPLKLDERVLGVIYVDNRMARGMFGPDDAALLQAMASHVAVALERTRAAGVEMQLQAERQQRRMAQSLGTLAGAGLELEDVFTRLLQSLEMLLTFDVAHAVVMGSEGPQAVVRRTEGRTLVVEEATAGADQAPLIARVLENRRPAMAHSDLPGSGSLVDSGMPDVTSWLAVPLLLADGVVGVVCLGRRGGSHFQPAETDLAMALASQAAMGVENARRFGEQHDQLARTRQRFLAAQIRPHFLFNALNSIASLVTIEPPRAEGLILSLSRFLRQSFVQPPDWSTLREELRYLEAYLDIEKARFGQRLRVTIDVDDSALGCRMPSMTLQPLVENSVRHGVTSRAEGGTISVRAHSRDDGVDVVVEDDGVGFDPDTPRPPSGSGVGLGNVRERLMSLIGVRVRFCLDSAPGRGTRISFWLPEGVSAGEKGGESWTRAR